MEDTATPLGARTRNKENPDTPLKKATAPLRPAQSAMVTTETRRDERPARVETPEAKRAPFSPVRNKARLNRPGSAGASSSGSGGGAGVGAGDAASRLLSPAFASASPVAHAERALHGLKQQMAVQARRYQEQVRQLQNDLVNARLDAEQYQREHESIREEGFKFFHAYEQKSVTIRELGQNCQRLRHECHAKDCEIDQLTAALEAEMDSVAKWKQRCREQAEAMQRDAATIHSLRTQNNQLEEQMQQEERVVQQSSQSGNVTPRHSPATRLHQKRRSLSSDSLTLHDILSNSSPSRRVAASVDLIHSLCASPGAEAAASPVSQGLRSGGARIDVGLRQLQSNLDSVMVTARKAAVRRTMSGDARQSVQGSSPAESPTKRRLHDTIAHLRVDVASRLEERDRAAAEIIQLKDELARSKHACSAAQTSREQLQAQLSEAREQLTRRDEQVREMSDRLQTTLAALRTAQESAQQEREEEEEQGELRDLREQLSEALDSLDFATAEKDGAEEELRATAERARELQETVVERNGRVEELEQAMAAHELVSQELHGRIAEVQASVVEAQARTAQVEREMEALRGKSETETAALRDAVTMGKREVTQLRARVSSLAEMEQSTSRLRTEMSQLRREIAEKERQIVEKTEEVETINGALERALRSLDEMETRREEREDTVVRPLQAELQEMRTTVRRLEKEREREGEGTEKRLRTEKEQLQMTLMEYQRKAEEKMSTLQLNLGRAESEVESLDALLEHVKTVLGAQTRLSAPLQELMAEFHK